MGGSVGPDSVRSRRVAAEGVEVNVKTVARLRVSVFP